MILKSLETEKIKITVEERKDGAFIATFWDKEQCYEFDRKVSEFETFGGAISQAFDYLGETVCPEVL